MSFDQEPTRQMSIDKKLSGYVAGEIVDEWYGKATTKNNRATDMLAASTALRIYECLLHQRRRFALFLGAQAANWPDNAQVQALLHSLADSILREELDDKVAIAPDVRLFPKLLCPECGKEQPPETAACQCHRCRSCFHTWVGGSTTECDTPVVR